jgi:hypothetical protein
VRCGLSTGKPNLGRMSLIDASNEPKSLKTAKEPRISKRLREAIRLLTTPECKTQRAAAQKLGMSETYLCEALKKPEIRMFIERSARQTVGLAVLRASHRTVELIDSDSPHVSLDASKHVLAIAGIKPSADANVSVNVGVNVGWIIDLTNGRSAAQQDKHESAVQIIDQDEGGE